MEIVVMDMKFRGMYIVRQLSFIGVIFKIEEVFFFQSYVKMYNKVVKLVRIFFLVFCVFNVFDNVFISFVQCQFVSFQECIFVIKEQINYQVFVF